MELDKVKEKLAKKLIKSINDSKSVDLVTFLSALGTNWREHSIKMSE